MVQNKWVAGILTSSLLITTLGSASVMASGIRGSGKLATETRKMAAYHAIKLEVPAELSAEVGSAGDLSIEADDNLLPHIRTTVANGELWINTDQSISNAKRIVIKTKTARLDKLNLSGAASIAVKGLAGGNFVLNAEGASTITLQGKLDKLSASLQGASKLNAATLTGGEFGVKAEGGSLITAQGKVDKLSATLDGASSLKAADLVAKTAVVSISGAGSAEINATSDLNATISGVGSIKYKGNPKITRHIDGLGTIQKF